MSRIWNKRILKVKFLFLSRITISGSEFAVWGCAYNTSSQLGGRGGGVLETNITLKVINRPGVAGAVL